jgi:acyl-coenzyme A thioesterase PaaI-like protein
MYVAVLAAIGPVPLAVTINLNINFLRKAAPRDLLAEARLLKLGKRLATGEVTICSQARRSPSPTRRRRIRSRPVTGTVL